MSEYRVQEPPFTVKLEMCEGCNLRCDFCGLQGIRAVSEKNFKFMKPEWIDNITGQMAALGWRSRIEFALHGEPTMNPDFVELVRITRSNLPKTHIMMTSNGGGFLRKPGPAQQMRDIFAAGLNVLALDDYKGANIVGKIRASIEKEGGPGESVHMFESPADPLGNPYRRHPVSYKMVTFITDLTDTAGKGNGIRSHMNNGAGAAFPLNEAMAGKRCARPFREFSVRWDGNVDLCCNSWRGTYKPGNAMTDGVGTVWQSPAMNAARRKLYRGERDFGPCAGCDSHSFRVGLLPDPVGKQSLPPADADDMAAIQRALSGPQYTPSVLRPWEKK